MPIGTYSLGCQGLDIFCGFTKKDQWEAITFTPFFVTLGV